MSADKPEQAEGWEALAEEEAEGGVQAMAPSDELEAALREASDAVGGEKKAAADSGVGSADKVLLEVLSAELQTLKTEYEMAVEELDKTRDQQLRLQAEFENFRRRTLKDKQDSQLYGHQNFVKELLSTVDNLDRAIEHSEQSAGEDLQTLLQGVELVQKELLGVLERFGVSEIEAEGQKFDPTYHEGVAQVPSAEAENTVVQVLQKGYQLRDRMLRPARVVVAKAEETEQPEPDVENAEDGD